MHTPVLLDEAIGGLQIRRDGTYIDATLGEGGHFKKILEKGAKALGIDRDKAQVEKLREQLKEATLAVGNFADIEQIARDNAFFPVDGVLLDLGLSYGQLVGSGRGFSYKKLEEPLDMRLDLQIERTTEDLINSLDENQLYEILAKNAEEINSRAIAHALVVARRVRKIEKVGDLIKIIDKALGKKDEKVYARVFQALRMEVNAELENLRKGLGGALRILKDEGRIAVISFHSVEDRIIKKFIKESNLRQIEKLKKKTGAGFERSATLRVFTKN